MAANSLLAPVHLCWPYAFYHHYQYMWELSSYQWDWMEESEPLEHQLVPAESNIEEALTINRVFCSKFNGNQWKTSVHKNTSLGSASIPTMAASMASWFSSLEAWAAIRTTVSASTPFVKTYIQKNLRSFRKRSPWSRILGRGVYLNKPTLPR